MWQLEEGINHQILGVKGLIQYNYVKVFFLYLIDEKQILCSRKMCWYIHAFDLVIWYSSLFSNQVRGKDNVGATMDSMDLEWQQGIIIQVGIK